MNAKLSELKLVQKAANSWPNMANEITASIREQRCKAVIVTDHPSVFATALVKAWKREERKLQKIRASTSDAARLIKISEEIAWMQSRRFSNKASPEALELLEVDILFATPDELLRWAPDCGGLYITCPVIRETLHHITAWMPKGGLVMQFG